MRLVDRVLVLLVVCAVLSTSSHASVNPQAVLVQGTAASGTAIADNPLQEGLRAATVIPTAVANGQAVHVMGDKVGRTIVVNAAPRDLITQNQTTITASTSETTILAQVASTFLDLTCLVLSNTSSTACRVDIRDSTAGTIRFSVNLAASGGGAVMNFNPPIPQATVNNNWTATCSTSVTDIRITAVAVQNN